MTFYQKLSLLSLLLLAPSTLAHTTPDTKETTLTQETASRIQADPSTTQYSSIYNIVMSIIRSRVAGGIGNILTAIILGNKIKSPSELFNIFSSSFILSDNFLFPILITERYGVWWGKRWGVPTRIGVEFALYSLLPFLKLCMNLALTKKAAKSFAIWALVSATIHIGIQLLFGKYNKKEQPAEGNEATKKEESKEPEPVQQQAA